MANTSQGLYAPLPQSISDSDSEKELQTEPIRPKPLNGMHKKITNGYMIPNHTVHNLKNKPMSFGRKIAFILSILTCFLTVGIFLWVLPCTGTCQKHISNWDNQRDDFEYIGRINIVPSAFPNVNNLVLLIKKSLIKSNDTTDGVISILGNNGEVAWLIPQSNTPKEVNCYLIDVNNDGIFDCLLIGESGIELIEPISGEIFYRVQSSDKRSFLNIDLPIVINDLNKDGVKEMITVVNGKNYHNKLIIISGKSGVVLSKIVFKHCFEVKFTEFDENLIFSCRNSSSKVEYFEITLKSVEDRYKNKTFEVNPIKINFSDKNEEYNLKNEEYKFKIEEYKLKNRKLVVKNEGICPKCSTNLTLYDENNQTNWFLTRSNSYVMKPTSFSFQPTKTNLISLKGHLNGFIIKFWHFTFINSNGDYLKRSISNENEPRTNLINERVVLITFNESNVHVINASLTQITQLCFIINSEDVCQPSLENEENSLEINDLDHDGSLELISYNSEYVNNDGNWRLVSNMKVIRLETELPKLYDGAK